MRITIDGGADEIAALVLAVQERRRFMKQEQIKGILEKQLQLPSECSKQYCSLLIDGKEFAKVFISHQGNHD